MSVHRQDELEEQFSQDVARLHDPMTKLKLVYISIGSFVRRIESVDQQLPSWVRYYFKDRTCKDNIKVYLIDPNYLNQIPLGLQQELSDWVVQSSNKQTQLYRRGQAEVFVSNHAIEHENAKILEALKMYIKTLLLNNVQVIIGVFCVPYMIVPENVDIVTMYHTLTEDKELNIHPSAKTNLIYFHLADYATRQDSPSTSPPHGTLVWALKNFQKLNQDEAVMKEYARFEYPKSVTRPESTSSDYSTENVSFGVSSYVLHPGTQFTISHLTETTLNYKDIQNQIHAAVLGKIDSILSSNECDIDSVLSVDL